MTVNEENIMKAMIEGFSIARNHSRIETTDPEFTEYAVDYIKKANTVGSGEQLLRELRELLIRYDVCIIAECDSVEEIIGERMEIQENKKPYKALLSISGNEISGYDIKINKTNKN